jgi:hypothetical protein
MGKVVCKFIFFLIENEYPFMTCPPCLSQGGQLFYGLIICHISLFVDADTPDFIFFGQTIDVNFVYPR